jgi:hypothetical protein
MWTMFSTTIEQSLQVAGFFLLPASAIAMSGTAFEEVQFARDEMANMAWAIEHVVPNGLGDPWLAQDQALAADLAGDTTPADEGLHYRIATPVPEHWHPLLPVNITSAGRSIRLVRGAVLTGDGTATPEPAGRVLRAPGYPEEEIPRDGVRVDRAVLRARGPTGSTHLWIGRRKTLGTGGTSSGLRFDDVTEVT